MAADLIFDELLEVIGADALLKLIEARGGTRVYIPDDPENSGMPGLIGAEAAQALTKHYGRGSITVPLAKAWRAAHYRRVEALSHAAIAMKLGMSEDAVQKLLRRSLAPPSTERPSQSGDRAPLQTELFPTDETADAPKTPTRRR